MDMMKKGYLYGFWGVAGFSLTLPATRAAVADLDPLVVGLGRALVAALLAAIVLLVTRQKLPSRQHLSPLVLTAAGVVIGFPLFTSWAMKHVDASHGSVVLGILPLATACFAMIFGQERPSAAFWATALCGSAIVVGFSLKESAGQVQLYDLALIGAVASAGLGYAIGAELAKELGAWQVICWALLLSAPVLSVPVGLRLAETGFAPTWTSFLGLLYVSCISMFLAFFAWYKGLALGGTAKVGLIQLMQPFMTIAASALLLNEQLSVTTLAAAGLVVVVVFIAQRTRVNLGGIKSVRSLITS